MACSACEQNRLAREAALLPQQKQQETMKMTAQIKISGEAITNISGVLNRSVESLLRLGTVWVLGTIDHRIFIEGKDASGGLIKGGEGYSVYGTVIDTSNVKMSAAQLRNIKKISKQLRSDPDKRFFVGGYKAYKGAMGYQTDYIDLQFTGQLRSDFTIFPNIYENTYGIGWQNPRNGKVAAKLEGMFGYIFSMTDGEFAEFMQFITAQLTKNLQQ